MRRTFVALAALSMLLGAVALPAAAGEGSYRHNKSDVYLISNEEVDIGNSHLWRSERGLATYVRAAGLTPGHAITVWWVIFNDPAGCLTPYHCGIDDVIGEAFGGNATGSQVSVPYATGGVVNHRGVYRGVAWQGLGPADGSANTFLGDPDFGLLNPMGAEVHLVLRDHGPLQQGQIVEQLTTFAGGCDPDANAEVFWVDFVGTFPVAPGECNDIAFTENPSPDAL